MDSFFCKQKLIPLGDPKPQIFNEWWRKSSIPQLISEIWPGTLRLVLSLHAWDTFGSVQTTCSSLCRFKLAMKGQLNRLNSSEYQFPIFKIDRTRCFSSSQDARKWWKFMSFMNKSVYCTYVCHLITWRWTALLSMHGMDCNVTALGWSMADPSSGSLN